MKDIYFILLFIITVSNISICQNWIKGIVIDASTNVPLINATVYINALENGMVTNELGQFSIKSPNLDSVKLTISYVGYLSKDVFLMPNQDLYTIPLQTNSCV